MDRYINFDEPSPSPKAYRGRGFAPYDEGEGIISPSGLTDDDVSGDNPRRKPRASDKWLNAAQTYNTTFMTSLPLYRSVTNNTLSDADLFVSWARLKDLRMTDNEILGSIGLEPSMIAARADAPPPTPDDDPTPTQPDDPAQPQSDDPAQPTPTQPQPTPTQPQPTPQPATTDNSRAIAVYTSPTQFPLATESFLQYDLREQQSIHGLRIKHDDNSDKKGDIPSFPGKIVRML